MSLEKSTEPRKMIVAYRLRVILKNGVSILYTHVTEFGNRKEEGRYIFIVNGETLDGFGMPTIVFDKHFIQHIQYIAVEELANIEIQK